jgi:hypothetical protein
VSAFTPFAVYGCRRTSAHGNSPSEQESASCAVVAIAGRRAHGATSEGEPRGGVWTQPVHVGELRPGKAAAPHGRARPRGGPRVLRPGRSQCPRASLGLGSWKILLRLGCSGHNPMGPLVETCVGAHASTGGPYATSPSLLGLCLGHLWTRRLREQGTRLPKSLDIVLRELRRRLVSNVFQLRLCPRGGRCDSESQGLLVCRNSPKGGSLLPVRNGNWQCLRVLVRAPAPGGLSSLPVPLS